MADGSTVRSEVQRVDGELVATRLDELAAEEPLEIQLTYGPADGRVTRSISVTMRTPGADRELALGFLYTEGILQSPDQLEPEAGPERRAPANVVRLPIRPEVSLDLARLERHFYTSSSCGVCGKASVAALAMARRVMLDATHPSIEIARLHALPAALRAAQPVFGRTGGLHAAALFQPDGTLLDLREDVGRHNAVDKLVGAQFLARALPLRDHVLLVSGRASYELLQKTLMAGIPIFAAVGAPSSLAVDVARAYGLTLVGFLRDEHFNVYSGAQRLRGFHPAGAAEAPAAVAAASNSGG